MADSQLDADFNAAFAPAPVAPAPAPVQVAPQAPSAPVNVFTPDGDLASIDSAHLPSALEEGYRQATPEEVDSHFQQEKYGTAGQQIKTGLEGAASAATFGLSTGLETATGLATPEDIRGRRETNSGIHGIGQAIGLGATSLIPGLGEANAAKALETAGAAGVKALGLGAAESTAAKIGSAAARGFIENATFQTQDEVSKIFTRDPAQNIGTAAADIGLAGLIGGVIGGGVGSVAPLWQATIGKETHGTLNAITNRLGGIEGAQANPIDEVLTKAGMADTIAPEIRGAMSDDPTLKAAALHLSQSDTTGSGKAFQESIQNFHRTAEDSMINALGHNPEAVDSLAPLSKYETGKSLGKSLADEYAAKVDPVAEQYDAFRSRYKNVELDSNIEDKAAEYEKAKINALRDLAKQNQEATRALRSSDPEKAIEASAKLQEATERLKQLNREGKAPGTTDEIASKISELAQREGWTQSASSEQMGLVNTILKELPQQKTLQHLSDYISLVGDKANRDAMNFPLKRAGQLIKGVMKDAEGEVLSKAVGKKEGGEAVAALSKARQEYASVSKIKEALDDRLHLKGSTSRYAKLLREAAGTDGETILRKLSTSGDADLLNVLTEHFPKTAESLKKYHLNNLLETAADKARNGQKINPTALSASLSKMSPELKAFILKPEASGKISAVSELLDRLKNSKYNFSNTARTVDSLTGHIPGGIAGLITALASGHIGAGVAVAQGFKGVTKGIPDYMRLSLLKFLGTSKPLDAGAFNTLVQSMRATVKGENAVAKGVKNIFNSAEKAGISTLVSMPSDKDREKLNKIVVESQTNPAKFTNLGAKVGYYAPEHGTAVAQTSFNALQFLNSQRPDTQPRMPLDSKLPPDPGKLTNYNRMLDLANKPLIVMDKIKAGSITPNEIIGLKTMYPGLYNNLVEKLTNTMNDHMADGGTIPYRTRIGLSMFAGMPLDSTMTPQAILSAQPHPKQPEQQQGAPNKPPPASSTKGISKLPASYATADQTRDQRAQKSR